MRSLRPCSPAVPSRRSGSRGCCRSRSRSSRRRSSRVVRGRAAVAGVDQLTGRSRHASEPARSAPTTSRTSPARRRPPGSGRRTGCRATGTSASAAFRPTSGSPPASRSSRCSCRRRRPPRRARSRPGCRRGRSCWPGSSRGLVEAVLVRDVVDDVVPVEEVRDCRVPVVLRVLGQVEREVEVEPRAAVGRRSRPRCCCPGRGTRGRSCPARS